MTVPLGPPQEGGGRCKAVLQREDEKPSDDDAISVEDNGDGSLCLTYTVTRAGPFSLELAVEGQEGAVRRLSGECVAARAVGRHCVVEPPPGTLVAGERGCMHVTRYDRCFHIYRVRNFLRLGTP